MIGNEFRRIALAQGLLPASAPERQQSAREMPPPNAPEPDCQPEMLAIAEECEQTA